MKRSIFVLASVALALSGCSGAKKAPAETEKAAPKQEAKKDAKGKGKKAKPEEPHVNPWAKDAPAGAVAEAPVKGKKAPPKKGAKPEEHVNPWAKEGPESAGPA